MDAKELRIGNYAYPFDDIGLVNHQTIIRDCIKVTYRDFENTLSLEPIPLTEQWILDFGFKCENATFSFKNIRYNILRVERYTGFLFCDENNVLTNIKHVHQLQNLYFALTNKELIKI